MVLVHLHVHGACPCSCFLSMLQVHVHAAHHRCVCVCECMFVCMFVCMCVFVCVNAGMQNCPASDQFCTGLKKTNDAGTGPVPDQAKAVRHFFGSVPDWNFRCRNADAGVSFLANDASYDICLLNYWPRLPGHLLMSSSTIKRRPVQNCILSSPNKHQIRSN
jgi:hypothetical protein